MTNEQIDPKQQSVEQFQKNVKLYETGVEETRKNFYLAAASGIMAERALEDGIKDIPTAQAVASVYTSAAVNSYLKQNGVDPSKLDNVTKENIARGLIGMTSVGLGQQIADNGWKADDIAQIVNSQESKQRVQQWWNPKVTEGIDLTYMQDFMNSLGAGNYLDTGKLANAPENLGYLNALVANKDSLGTLADRLPKAYRVDQN